MPMQPLKPARRAAAAFALGAAVAVGFLPGTAAAADLEEQSRSVVKLYVTQQHWDDRQPWTKTPSRKVTCSGVFVEEGILTNAHCVTEATFVEVEMLGHMRKYQADVKAVNHQIDLALVAIPEAGIMEDAEIADLGELPRHRDNVVTVGYPVGGRQVSYTEGVVSRIDIMRYAHSNLPSLLVQTDAAINPGNSGGPVYDDDSGDLIGIATQKNRYTEGQGYFVPVPMIRHFLNDQADGEIAGIPNLGIGLQTLENDAHRDALGLDAAQTGVRVRDVAAGSSADGHLAVDDVIVAIDGHPVHNDGRVPFRGGSKIGFGYYVYTHQVGDTVVLNVVRDGNKRTVEIELAPYRYSVIPHMPQYGAQPRYLVQAGIVFVAVEPRFLSRWGGVFSRKLPTSLAVYRTTPLGEEGLEELVVISAVYDASINRGYAGNVENDRVVSVNGRPVKKLNDVATAMAEGKGERWLTIELESGHEVVLDQSDMAAADAEIRERYNIQ